MQIYSKVKNNKVLINLLKFQYLKNKRSDIPINSEFFQVTRRKLNKDLKVKVLKYNFFKRVINFYQKILLVFNGKILITFGDSIKIFKSRHEQTLIKYNTYFYKNKSKLYYEVEKDQLSINEN